MKDLSFSLARIANISFLANKKRHEMMVQTKGISNTVCYDMLAQPKYREYLQYVPILARGSKKGKSNEFELSDQLRKHVDYPFIKED